MGEISNGGLGHCCQRHRGQAGAHGEGLQTGSHARLLPPAVRAARPQAAQWGRAVGPEPQRTLGRQSEPRPGGAAAARLLTGTQSEAHGQSEPKAQGDLWRL